MKSTLFRTSMARKPISSRLPIGVDIIYRPFFKLFILYILTIIISCSPQNNNIVNNILKSQNKAEDEKNLILSKTESTQEKISNDQQTTIPFSTNIILNQVENGVAVRMAILYLLAEKLKIK